MQNIVFSIASPGLTMGALTHYNTHYQMNSNLYPTSPKLESYDFIRPSKTFKRVARSVIWSIILFFLFYLILVILSAVLMVASGWAGITIISFNPNFITLGVGIGIIALGGMFFIFLVKFIFSRTKNDNPLRMELKKENHPDLFQFIQALTNDTKTKFPKKIFVSPEVNALVFYNSSFWSLFFPVKKNLEIGLGLINTLNISEFKSVLAHEFGHFSQRSMKIGSYIYTVNRAIYNLVYEYDSWDEWLTRWSESGGIFGFFAGITFWMVERIRGLLKFAYNLINISYMKLSREMEYHADLVAVSVGGNKPFKNALRKIEFSSYTYDYTTSSLNSLASQEKSSHNIFRDHTYITNLFAKHYGMIGKNGKLTITDDDLNSSVTTSRVNVKDQWASHPTLKEREENIARVEVSCEENTNPAWMLFSNAEDLQTQVTSNLYHIGFPGTHFEGIKEQEFSEFIHNEINRYKISEAYNGYYDNRYLTEFDPGDLLDSPATNESFPGLYSIQNAEIIKRQNVNKNDIEVLRHISLKQIPTKYFEFDGKKYKRKAAKDLMQTLQVEIELGEKKIEELDRLSFVFNYQSAQRSGSEAELFACYKKYFSSLASVKDLEEVDSKFQNFTNRLYSQFRWTNEEFRLMATELSGIEKEFKVFLEKQEIGPLLENLEPASQREVLKEYIGSENFYSKTSTFEEQSLINLSSLINDISISVGTLYGTALKRLTDYQLELQKDMESSSV